jgi:hypothetical protein
MAQIPIILYLYLFFVFIRNFKKASLQKIRAEKIEQKNLEAEKPSGATLKFYVLCKR